MNKFTKKSIYLIVLTILILSALAGCSKSSDGTVKGGEKEKFVNGKLTKPVTLKVLRGGAFDYTIAEQKGFLKEVGIKTKYVGQLQGGTLAQAVAKGDIDLFSSGHVIDIAMARAAGINLKIVLEGMVDNPDADKAHMVYFVKKNSGIRSAKDLIGKKIGIVSRGSCAEIISDQYLKEHGIDKKKVQFIPMPDTQQVQALKQGQIDVAVLHQPYSYVARKDKNLKVLEESYDVGKKAGDGSVGGLAVRAFSEDFIKKNPEVVKAYIAADVKAQVWAREHFDEAKKIYAKFNGTPVSGGNQTPTEKWVEPKKVQFWINMCVNNGFLKKDSVKASDLYTNAYNPYYTGKLKLATPVSLPKNN